MRSKFRKKREENQEDHFDETWAIPYADLLTLLFALFIVLFAASSIDKAKYEVIMESFKTELTGKKVETSLGSLLASTSNKNINVEKSRATKLDSLLQKLNDYIKTNQLQTMITLKDSNRGVEITLKDDILYDPGKADLKESSFKMLDAIAGVINTVQNPISIEGYTDNVPIGNAAFASNWELSAARAASVLHYLESKNIADQRLQFTGYGEFKPLYPNDTQEHRQENRRVNIVILRND